ncbi:RNA polymerase subunit sigma-70 [Nocardia heshunensis]
MNPDRQFTESTEPHRRELLAHCYRMVGSVDEAEDLVQETYLRAWRGYSGFDGRSSLRTWLYKIATNVCLTALERRSRRPLPSGLGAPEADWGAALADGSGVEWLQPIPDALVSVESDDPAAIVVSRESLRLALVAGLQYLPPRQRAVLLLRDVLDWPASDVAELLETSVAAVKSALQRARATLDQVSPARDRVIPPTDADSLALLERYIAAFENADLAELEHLLLLDASLEMPPSSTWFAGRRTCLPFLAEQVLPVPGLWRLVPTAANGGPAAVAYRRSDNGEELSGVVLLDTTCMGISRIVFFEDSLLAARFLR